MAGRRQIALWVSMPLVLLVSFTSAALATEARMAAFHPLGKGGGGGGAFPAAGNYVVDTTSAFSELDFSDTSQTSIFLSVSIENDVSQPQGSPRTTTSQSVLNYNFSTDQGFGASGSGCVTLSPGDFVTSGVQTATLHATVTADSPGPCGFPPFGVLPLTIAVTWTASSPALTISGQQRFACAGYTNESQSTSSGAGAGATIAFSSETFSGTFDVSQGSINIGSRRLHAQGAVPPDTCAQSIGKGAFGGFQAAGTYHTTSEQAFANFSTPDFTPPFVFVGVNRIAKTSSPPGGPTTSSNETQLTLSVTSNELNGSGCWVINPGDFTATSDQTAAAVHTTITAETPACYNNNDLNPPSVAVDVVWAGPGPISTILGTSQISCAGYHNTTTTMATLNGGATASISLGTLGPLSAPAQVGMTDTRTDASGTLDADCTFH